MKYLTIINQQLADGTDASAMHSHDTRAEAESEYFSELASGIVSPTLKSVFAVVVSTDGSILRIETVGGLASSKEPATETAQVSSEASGTASGQ